MDSLHLWGLFVAIGLGTYLIRLSFVQLHARREINTAGMQTLLKLLPPAILSALCIPPIFQSSRTEAAVIDTHQLLAAGMTILLSLYCKSVFWPIVGGMLVLWSSRWLGV